MSSCGFTLSSTPTMRVATPLQCASDHPHWHWRLASSELLKGTRNELAPARLSPPFSRPSKSRLLHVGAAHLPPRRFDALRSVPFSLRVDECPCGPPSRPRQPGGARLVAWASGNAQSGGQGRNARVDHRLRLGHTQGRQGHSWVRPCCAPQDGSALHLAGRPPARTRPIKIGTVRRRQQPAEHGAHPTRLCASSANSHSSTCRMMSSSSS